MTKKARIVAGSVAALILIGAIVALSITFPLIKMAINQNKYDLTPFSTESPGDRIYFLNTGSADAILIESDGKFALVDGAEDSDNPRGFEGLVYEGTEEYVLDCIKTIAGDENGQVTLEFVLGTHAHSDHYGGLNEVILDDSITVKQVFVKAYDESLINSFEVTNWDNLQVYEGVVHACQRKNVPLVNDLPKESFQLGNFDVTICNTEAPASDGLVGENENSLGVLLEKGSQRAFLAGDITTGGGDEDRLADEIGDVDLLKIGHHGYEGSTSKNFASKLDPEVAILTNSIHGMHKPPLRALNKVNAAIYATKENSGIAAEFADGKIVLYNNIDAILT